MQETRVRSLGWKDLLEKEMATTQVFLPGTSHRQRSLEGYSPWGHIELDTIEPLSTHAQHTIVLCDQIPKCDQIIEFRTIGHAQRYYVKLPCHNLKDRLQSN